LRRFLRKPPRATRSAAELRSASGSSVTAHRKHRDFLPTLKLPKNSAVNERRHDNHLAERDDYTDPRRAARQSASTTRRLAGSPGPLDQLGQDPAGRASRVNRRSRILYISTLYTKVPTRQLEKLKNLQILFAAPVVGGWPHFS
jgi:hypothetical protein